MCGYFACVYVCVLYIYLVPLEARRGHGIPLRLELTVVSCQVGARSRIQQVLLPSEPSLQPLTCYVCVCLVYVHECGCPRRPEEKIS